MVTDQGIKNINLYDIFANIIPGLAFLLGLVVPFEVSASLQAIFGSSEPLSFTIGQILLLVAVAFILGQLLQAFGSRFDGDHGFSDFVRKLKGEDVQTRYEITEFDNSFWVFCKKEFQLTDDFEAYDRLFNAVYSFLETSNRNRALRMQALYLFSRGVRVAAVFLLLLYTAIYISLYYDYIPIDLTEYVRDQRAVLSGIVITWVLAQVANHERREFERDWLEYTVTEFYLELVDEYGKSEPGEPNE